MSANTQDSVHASPRLPSLLQLLHSILLALRQSLSFYLNLFRSSSLFLFLCRSLSTYISLYLSISVALSRTGNPSSNRKHPKMHNCKKGSRAMKMRTCVLTVFFFTQKGELSQHPKLRQQSGGFKQFRRPFTMLWLRHFLTRQRKSKTSENVQL